MLPLRRAPSQATEEATTLLNRAYADWSRTTSSIAGKPRLGGASMVLISHDPMAISLQAVYARLVSVAEAYTDIVVENLFVREFPQRGRILAALVENALDVSSMKWEERKNALRMHGAPVAEFKLWSQFDVAIDVRNAIVHGLGGLTRRQRKDVKTTRKLASLDIHVQAGRIVLEPRHLLQGRDLCVRYVQWLDGKTAL